MIHELTDAQKSALSQNGRKGGEQTQALRRALQSFKINILVHINEQENNILTQTLAKKLCKELFNQSINITELSKYMRFSGNNKSKLSRNLDDLAKSLANRYKEYVESQMTEQFKKML
ncbi:glycosyl hydrolase 53 family protein [Pseudomonas aeruginosa]|uniref:glycosyl hydrolase 53 family protein n=1 Tax=Pseudomonas aeruginosa TaxID=287 RepID=UPI001FFD9E80|nr:glycosyl hydrolase 53 family protein [Pseudomonas aeruginosa]